MCVCFPGPVDGNGRSRDSRITGEHNSTQRKERKKDSKRRCLDVGLFVRGREGRRHTCDTYPTFSDRWIGSLTIRCSCISKPLLLSIICSVLAPTRIQLVTRNPNPWFHWDLTVILRCKSDRVSNIFGSPRHRGQKFEAEGFDFQ